VSLVMLLIRWQHRDGGLQLMCAASSALIWVEKQWRRCIKWTSD